MNIVTDKEGMQAINQLLDIALKSGGLNNFSQVNQIANSCRLDEALGKAEAPKAVEPPEAVREFPKKPDDKKPDSNASTKV